MSRVKPSKTLTGGAGVGGTERPRDLMDLFCEHSLEEIYIAGSRSLKHHKPVYVHSGFAVMACAGLAGAIMSLQTDVCGIDDEDRGRRSNGSCSIPLLAGSAVHALWTGAYWLWYAVGGGMRGAGDAMQRARENKAIATAVSLQALLVVGLTTFVGIFGIEGEFHADHDDDILNDRKGAQAYLASFNTIYILGCAMVASTFFLVGRHALRVLTASMCFWQLMSLIVLVVDGSRSLISVVLDMVATCVYCSLVVYAAHLLDNADRKNFLLARSVNAARSAPSRPREAAPEYLAKRLGSLLTTEIDEDRVMGDGAITPARSLESSAKPLDDASGNAAAAAGTGKMVKVRRNSKGAWNEEVSVPTQSASSTSGQPTSAVKSFPPGLSPLGAHSPGEFKRQIAALSPHNLPSPAASSRSRGYNKSKSKLSLNSNFFDDTDEPESGRSARGSMATESSHDNASEDTSIRETMPSTATMSINDTPSVCGSTTSSRNGDVFQNHPLADWNSDEFKQKLVKLDLIGRGNSSTVNIAVDAVTGQVVALKTMTMSGGVKAMLQQEMVALSSDQNGSPYMVSYFGAFTSEEENKCSLAVEFMANGDLESWVEAKQELPEEFLAVIAYQVCKALAKLNENQRMHRDVKPGNVLISSTGQVKLSDFGMCADVKATPTGTGCDMSLSRGSSNVGFSSGGSIHAQLRQGQFGPRQVRHSETLNEFVGTYRYMSPERLTADEYSYSADVWAVGLTLATCVLGECPFSKDCSFWHLLQQSDLPQTRVMQKEGLSTDLRDFITMCLRKEASERPEAKDMLQHPFVRKREDWTPEAWSRISKPCMAAREAKYTQSKLSAYVAQIDRRRRTLHARGLVSSPDIKTDAEATERLASDLGIKRGLLDDVYALGSGNLVAKAMQDHSTAERPRVRMSASGAYMSAIMDTRGSGNGGGGHMQMRATRHTLGAESLPYRLWSAQPTYSSTPTGSKGGLWDVPPEFMPHMSTDDAKQKERALDQDDGSQTAHTSYRRVRSAKNLAEMDLGRERRDGTSTTGSGSSLEGSGALDGLALGVSEVDSPKTPPDCVPDKGHGSLIQDGLALGQALLKVSEGDEFSSSRRLSDATERQRASSSRRRSTGAYSEVSSSAGDDVARLSEVSMSGDGGERLSCNQMDMTEDRRRLRMLKDGGMARQEKEEVAQNREADSSQFS